MTPCLKLAVVVHEECKQYMEEKQIKNNDEYLDEVDEMIFNFKRKVHSWLKETNEDDRCSKASSRTKSHSSRSSRKSSKSNNSGSFKSDRIEGKGKLAELLALESFLENRQEIENEAQGLKMQEKLAKAKVIAQIFKNVDLS